MLSTHVLNRGGRGVQRPADRLLAGPAGSVRTHEMRRKTHQRAPEITPASYWASIESRLLLLCWSEAITKQSILERFFRIYPPYLVALLFLALVYPISKLYFASRVDTAQFISHLTLLHNFDQRSFFGINAAFWSIAVEVQLYALYPLLLALAARFG